MKTRKRIAIDRVARPYLLLLGGLVAAGTACEDSLVDVSETETWWLELEQLDDGSDDRYPRRGTLLFELAANTTTQADPTCTGESTTDVTTFLADVQAMPSRMQDAGSGTADGSWNCHGFAATVRLGGLTYELRSDNRFGPSRSFGDQLWQ